LLDTPTMRRAAELWALARQRGTPTADPKEIDADVILAAQAERAQAVVATDNVGHLGRFVAAKHWRDLR
jgi:predicted nucleic acid-binding protein